MSKVQDVIARLRAGEVTATEAGAEIRRLMTLDECVPDGVAASALRSRRSVAPG